MYCSTRWRSTLKTNVVTHLDACTLCTETFDCVDTNVITAHARTLLRRNINAHKKPKKDMILVAHRGTSRKCDTRVPKKNIYYGNYSMWSERVYIQSGPEKKYLQWEFQAAHARGSLGGTILNNTDSSTNMREDSMEMESFVNMVTGWHGPM